MDGDSQNLLERVRRFAMPDGSVACRGFHLQQSGEIRLAPDKPWLPFEAEQWFAAAGLDFRWTARARLARILPVTVVDAFERGHGLLSVRIAGIIPVARAQGPQVDRGEVMRALAEMPWRPAGFLPSSSNAPQLAWSVPSSTMRAPDTLRAAFDDGRTRCYVDLEVDAEGRVLSAGAPDRPRGMGKTSVAMPWRGTFAEYKSFDGLCVPTQAEVAWLQPDGPFNYFRGRVMDFRGIR